MGLGLKKYGPVKTGGSISTTLLVLLRCLCDQANEVASAASWLASHVMPGRPWSDDDDAAAAPPFGGTGRSAFGCSAAAAGDEAGGGTIAVNGVLLARFCLL